MIALALAALIGAQATPTPQTQADSSPTVVVTGRRPQQDEAVRHMTAAIAPVNDAGQPLARFEQQICPQVEGLTPEMNGVFAARMRADARRAGLTTGGPACEPNVTVMIVDNGQAVVREMERTGASAFGDLGPADIRRLADDPAPAHLWSVTEVRSRDGDQLRGGTLTVRNASILQAVRRTDVVASVLLIDQVASVGKTVNQLADYAAMRTLASARPVGTAAAEQTILRLFDPGEATVPKALTAFDLAYLKALYHGTAIERPQAKVALMARAISRSLAQSVTPATPGGEPATR